MKSTAYTLTKDKIKHFLWNVLLFNVPTFCLIYLTSHSQGADIKQSLITASISFLTAWIDLVRKFSEESEHE